MATSDIVSVGGLTVFAYTVVVDLLWLLVDLMFARNGSGTLTQWLTGPGHELAIALVVALEVLGVIGLLCHLLA